MSQTWTDNTYDGSHIVATDQGNVEDNFATLKSTFSGTTSPSSAVVGQQYYDTDNFNVRVKHSTVWHAVMTGDASQKMWVYRNTACIGWVVDSSLTDRVISIKGGTYGSVGGVTGGNWTGLSHSHTGADHRHTGGGHAHTGANHFHTSPAHKHLTPFCIASGVLYTKDTVPGGSLSQTVPSHYHISDGSYSSSRNYEYTDNTTPGNTGYSGTGSTGASGTQWGGYSGTGSTSTRTQSSWRPQACVGTLQALDI